MASPKDSKLSNPIPAILELIPFGDTVLDLELADLIRNEILKHVPRWTRVSNADVLDLITRLEGAGLLISSTMSWPSAHGKLTMFKKVV